MANKLTIKSGNPALDGTYELELAGGFTKAEHFLMKKHVGVVLADLLPGAPIDMNVMTGWGLVMLHRAGKDHLFGQFMETKDDQTEWDFDDDEVREDDALPPASEPAADVRPSSASESSGLATNGHSVGSPAIAPSPTGSQPSDTGVISAPATSAS